MQINTAVAAPPQDDPRDTLHKNVAAILATVKNVERCIDGLDTVIYRVIERRMVKEDGRDISACADPCEAPPYSPLPRRERERIVPLIDAAIDASGLPWIETDPVVYAPLIEIESRARDRRRKARRRRIAMEARHG